MTKPSADNPNGQPLGLPLNDGLGAVPEARCGCRACLRERKDGITNYYKGQPYFVPAERYTMVLCATCGNKRCPHATDHRHACTGSNDPGQPGSWYGGLEAPNVGG
jgi:hypothetical protein